MSQYPTIPRLPRTFGSRNDKPRINEIAIGLCNDSSFFVIASEAKQSINNKRLMQKQKRKRSYYYLSSQRINFKWNINFQFSIFNFQFFSQPPCCFATSPLTKGGKPPQITNNKYKNKKEKEFTIKNNNSKYKNKK